MTTPEPHAAARTARLLIVDDEPNIRRLLIGVLEDEGYDARAVDSVEALDRALALSPVDVLLLDVCLPGVDGMEWLDAHFRSGSDDIGAVIMMSGHATVELALRAVRRGAVDFLEKPIHAERLLLSIENALALTGLRRENARLHQQIAPDMVGDGPALGAVREAIARAAPTDAGVLITGENGSGKELVASALHRASRRADGPFVQINCAAIPETLLEAELFGHEPGAFSGAAKRRRGHVERAHRGTLLLDEIGDMPLEMQAKLLRVLEDQTVTPLGAESSRRVDVRVLAATHRDLRARVEAGSFREDLYYRLAVLEITVPALRDRVEDLPALARHFLDVFAREFRRQSVTLDATAHDALARHAWPGNVRELRNAMARLVALHEGGRVDAEAVHGVLTSGGPAPAPVDDGAAVPHLHAALEATERNLIERALRVHAGNKAAAARALGIDRANLHRKMKRLGLDGRAG